MGGNSLELLGSLTAGGVVIVIVMRMLFNYLSKKNNNRYDCPVYLTKEDHDKDCAVKMNFLTQDINEIKKRIDDNQAIILKRIDDIYSYLIKSDGRK